MKLKSIIGLLSLTMLFFLSGCGQSNPKHSNVKTIDETPAILSAGQVEILPQAIRFNNQIKVPATNKDGFKNLEIIDVYFSALGKQCLALKDSLNQESIYCENQKNIYQPYPKLVN